MVRKFKNKYMKAKIKKVTRGKKKGQFAFILIGKNGQTIATSESYLRRATLTKTLKKYFPNFEIEV